MKYERLKQLVKDELGKDIDNPYSGELLGVNFTECGDFYVCKDGVYEHRHLSERSSIDRLVKAYKTEEELVKDMFNRITVYPKLRHRDKRYQYDDVFLERVKKFKEKYKGEL